MNTSQLNNLLDEIDQSEIATPFLKKLSEELEIPIPDLKYGIRSAIVLIHLGMKKV